ncbi:Pkinase-domain-containing protein, partial [Nadsonia fulvescens var. elongata DSM 6958]
MVLLSQRSSTSSSGYAVPVKSASPTSPLASTEISNLNSLPTEKTTNKSSPLSSPPLSPAVTPSSAAVQMAYLNTKSSKSSATINKLKGIFNAKKLAPSHAATPVGSAVGPGTPTSHPHPLQRLNGSSNSSSSSSLASLQLSSPSTPTTPVWPTNPSSTTPAPTTIPTLMLASENSSMVMINDTIPTINNITSPNTNSPSVSATSMVSPRPQLTSTPTNVISPVSSLNSIKGPAGRFILFGDDEAQYNHVHHLKSTRRQEKLGGMLRDILGTGKKVRDDAVSAVPDFVNYAVKPPTGKTGGPKDKSQGSQSPVLSDDDGQNNGGLDEHHLSLMSGLVSQIQKGEKEVTSVVRNGSVTCKDSNASLLQKYGKCQEVIGKGAYGIVRVSQKYDAASRCDRLFAVKEFKRRAQESENHFAKRLTSEFCLSSSLHHPNIIQTLDLMKDAKGEYCEVMEFCAGGDLYSLILASSGGLEQVEADCFFKQIIRGVVYMHDMGVAHCDLKPENILLSPNGSIKISDFGNGECFRMAWEKEIHLSSGICGSTPYIAPEEYRDKCFDPRAVDIWATGVIYMAMRTGSYLWKISKPDEDMYY